MEKFPNFEDAQKAIERPAAATKRIGDEIVFFCVCGRYLAKRIDWLAAHRKFACPDCGIIHSGHNILMVTDGVSEGLDSIRDVMRNAAEQVKEQK